LAEARAIRWAVKMGARVVNLSFAGTRDPGDPSVDGFSYQERRAIDFAVRSSALVVAAVGNGGDAPTKPWRFAGYPAALPHVLGVAAYGRSGEVPSFSNRDDVYVDLAAPGQDMLSLFPFSAHEGLSLLSRPGLFRLRHEGVPRRRRHLVLLPAGRRRRGHALFALAGDPAGPGLGDPRAERRRRHPGRRLQRMLGRP
jgi:hypothetical protein